ncbi:MAG: spore coat protein CotH [Clostridiales bacterium]|nr:spore coat protein CotH [Clostridiales bacterium]
MIRHRWIGPLSALLMAAAVLFLGTCYFMPSLFEGLAGAAEPPYAAAMDKTKVLDIQIVADETAWANMLQNATAEEYIPATIVIDGVKTNNVGIRPKGNSSLSMVAKDDTTDRYSFKIEFDHYVSGQSWLGLDKLVVNNMQGDATYMKEYLSYDLMAYAGVETPRYAFCDITVNGEPWGFYLAVEALEDSYARRVYGNDHGKLYKPEGMGMRGDGQMNTFMGGVQAGEPDEDGPQWQALPEAGALPPQEPGQAPPPGQPQGEFPAAEQGLSDRAPNPAPGGGDGGFGGQSGGATLQYTDDELSSYSAIFENAVFDSTDLDFARVIQALKQLSAGEELDRVVDVEATLRYFAAHAVIVNLDSYVSNMSHNYYLYEKDGRLTMLPWDFNLAFGGFQSGSASSVVNFPIDTPVSGIALEQRPMLAKLLGVPEYLEQYHSYLRQLVEGYFNSGLFVQTVDALDALISPHVQADPSAFYDHAAYQRGVAELKKLGLLRAQSIEGQLDGRIPATAAGQSANPDALVDASALSLSALGRMGGADLPGEGRAENEGADRAAMERAMAILQAAGEGELTEEQLAQLQALGLTEAQLALLQSRAQRGFGGAGERPDNGQEGLSGEVMQPGNGQDGFANGGGRPREMQAGAVRPVQGERPNAGGLSPAAPAGFDGNACLVLGGYAVSLLAGLLFVLFYRRRRPT